MYTLNVLGDVPQPLLVALLEFPDTHPMVEAWQNYPNVSGAEKTRTYHWGPEEVSQAFVAFLAARGVSSRVVHALDSPVPLHYSHSWVAVQVADRVVNVDWTARRFFTLDQPPQPLPADLPSPLVWLTDESFPADTHPVTGRYGTVDDPALRQAATAMHGFGVKTAGLTVQDTPPATGSECQETETDQETEVTCDRPADHECSDTGQRCTQHCICKLDDPTRVDVVLVYTVDDVTDPASACRDLLRTVREATSKHDALHFEVTPADGGTTQYVTLTGAQQFEKPSGR